MRGTLLGCDSWSEIEQSSQLGRLPPDSTEDGEAYRESVRDDVN